MATQAVAAQRLAAGARVAEGSRLHWLTVAASAWLLVGLYWDAWAHGYGLPDSFWTVWHAAFYSGYVALAAVIGGAVVANRGQAGSWRAAVPRGYGWAITGILVFGAGGAFDALWHSAFGIETSTEALVSPSHLTLLAGMLLLVSAPLRAARAEPRGLAATLPAVLSLTAIFSLFTLFTLFGGPYSEILGGGRRSSLDRQLLGIYVFAALLAGHALVALRRGFPPGSFTILVGLNGIAMILMRGHTPALVQVIFSGVAVAAGVIADVVLWRLRPAIDRTAAVRVLLFVLPASYFALYDVAVFFLTAFWWSPHVVLGVPLLAGFTGFLVSAIAVRLDGA